MRRFCGTVNNIPFILRNTRHSSQEKSGLISANFIITISIHDLVNLHQPFGKVCPAGGFQFQVHLVQDCFLKSFTPLLGKLIFQKRIIGLEECQKSTTPKAFICIQFPQKSSVGILEYRLPSSFLHPRKIQKKQHSLVEYFFSLFTVEVISTMSTVVIFLFSFIKGYQ